MIGTRRRFTLSSFWRRVKVEHISKTNFRRRVYVPISETQFYFYYLYILIFTIFSRVAESRDFNYDAHVTKIFQISKTKQIINLLITKIDTLFTKHIQY